MYFNIFDEKTRRNYVRNVSRGDIPSATDYIQKECGRTFTELVSIETIEKVTVFTLHGEKGYLLKFETQAKNKKEGKKQALEIFYDILAFYDFMASPNPLHNNYTLEEDDRLINIQFNPPETETRKTSPKIQALRKGGLIIDTNNNNNNHQKINAGDPILENKIQTRLEEKGIYVTPLDFKEKKISDQISETRSKETLISNFSEPGVHIILCEPNLRRLLTNVIFENFDPFPYKPGYTKLDKRYTYYVEDYPSTITPNDLKDHNLFFEFRKGTPSATMIKNAVTFNGDKLK